MATAVRKPPPKPRAPATGAAIAAALREAISSHAIAPGSKLLEAELAKDYGVPRSRVREALAELELRGLIRRIPNRGAEVARLELDQVYAIYDAREALEGMCVRLATLRAPRETWQKWVELLREGGPMEKALHKGDVQAYFESYEALRREIIDSAGNTVLATMLDSIYEKTRVIMRRVQILPGRAAQGLAEHRAFVKAMRAGDADEAERLRRENLRNAVQALRRYQQFVF